MRRRRARGEFDLLPQLVLDGPHIGRILDHGVHGPQTWIARVLERCGHELAALFLDHQAPVERGSLTKPDVRSHAASHGQAVLRREGRTLEVQGHDRLRLPVERYIDAAQTLLLGLGRHRRCLVPALPPTVLGSNVLHRLGAIKVARNGEHHILRTVEALEEGLRVGVLFRHALDVAHEANGGVLVGVAIKGLLLHGLEQHFEGAAASFAILAKDCASLGAEGRFVVGQVLEAVGLDLDHCREIFTPDR